MTELSSTSQKPRAAIVRLNYYPDDLLVVREATALRDLGFAVTVFCLRRTGERATELIEDVEVRRLPLQRKKSGALRNLVEYVWFFCLTAAQLTLSHWRQPFTVIQVNTMPDVLVFAALLPRWWGAKVTLMMYEPMPELWATRFRSSLPSMILRWLAAWSVHYADAVITVTEQLKASLLAYGIRREKVTVVLNVPAPRLFGRVPDPPSSAPEDNFILLCHGAIEERYGHDTMLRAMAILRRTLPQVRLRITGEGGYCKEFLALRSQLGLEDCVDYLGYVSLSELVQELSRTNAGIVAQKASPYSHLVHTGKMYDFLEFGKPVIASRLNAVRAYFGEESLQYFTPGDPDDLARAIGELVQQPDRQRALVANSQRLYAEYCWDRQHEKYCAVYRRWVSPSQEYAASRQTGAAA
jgi:glycosyltransferase involved in cell wall biosynthesis